MADETDARRVVEVVLPQLGESVAEGTVTAWLKRSGETVTEDEPLCEISTDKVNTDIPSPVAGEIRDLVVEEGVTVDVGTVLARIETDRPAEEAGGTAARGHRRADAAAATPEERLHFEDSSISLWGSSGAGGDRDEATSERAAADAERGAGARTDESSAAPSGRYSPAVRALAKKERVKLEEVRGTGRDGRVTREDVRRHLEERERSSGGSDEVGGRREPLSPVRRVIAERLVQSKSRIPHSTTVMEADLSAVAGVREREKSAFEQREKAPLTYLPFVASATLRALEEHPRMNAVFEGEAIRFRTDVNLGLAVATEEGLLVPVVHGAGSLPFPELARRMNDAARAARSGGLEPGDVQGGTFTLTNHGRGGSLWGTPIIVPGQTGILGVGKIRDVPVVVGGAVEVRKACHLSLSFDHRTVDGAGADDFLRTVVELLASFDVDELGKEP